jgi:GNAT superfamily N-acetyltransferase
MIRRVLEVRDVSRADAIRAGVILGNAFTDDPVWRAIGPRWRAHRRIVSILFHISEVLMALLYGGWVIGGYEDGRLVGVVVSFPDGEKRRPWLYGVTRTLPWILSAGGPVPGFKALGVEKQLDAVHPQEPHVHVWLLGAEPETRGVGAVLMKATDDRADKIGKRCYLEATAQHLVQLYRLLGYETTQTITVRGHVPIGLMWRDVGGRGGRRFSRQASEETHTPSEEVA